MTTYDSPLDCLLSFVYRRSYVFRRAYPCGLCGEEIRLSDARKHAETKHYEEWLAWQVNGLLEELGWE